ncbi:MAG: hypothetical protein VYA34_00655 [Myxococcota bacterium]|nr:hypothetical protein [Myxococcota bacterium]
MYIAVAAGGMGASADGFFEGEKPVWVSVSVFVAVPVAVAALSVFWVVLMISVFVLADLGFWVLLLSLPQTMLPTRSEEMKRAVIIVFLRWNEPIAKGTGLYWSVFQRKSPVPIFQCLLSRAN